MYEFDGTLCSLCDHVLLRVVYRRRKGYDHCFNRNPKVPRMQYGCAAVNVNPIKPHELPEGFDGDYTDICRSFIPMREEGVE